MLKSLLSAVAVIAITAPTAQAVEFINQDGSQLSQLCIAAAQSDAALSQAVEAQSLNRFELDRISCNDMSLNSFARKYRANNSGETVGVVAFENANNARETELCIAAATSNEAFAQTKARLFNSVDTDEVACNGVALVKFAKQYNKQFNG